MTVHVSVCNVVDLAGMSTDLNTVTHFVALQSLVQDCGASGHLARSSGSLLGEVLRSVYLH